MEAGNAVKQNYPQKSVELEIFISDAIENTIFKSDPFRIRQIINNLVGNAFKFTETGSVGIHAEVIGTDGDISTVKIRIIDTGIGISKEKQKLIFNEFTQAETDIAHRFGGSGLGLAISKKLAELLNGRLEVESVLGKGSCFTLLLPLENTLRKVEKRKPAQTLNFKDLKAVIIEDDNALRTLLGEILLKLGITPIAFSSFGKFKASGSNIEFNFILTDIQMPDANGFAILEELQSGKVDFYKGQPVLAMTGNRDHERQYYLDKGFAEMLPKPFSHGELIAALQLIFPAQIHNPSTVETEDEAYPAQTKVSSLTQQPFDLSLLNSFLSSRESLREILSVFESQTKQDLESLANAVTSKNVKTIKETAHRMLTMFRQLKAVEAIPILEKMELYPPEIQMNELDEDLRLLQRKATELLKALSALEI